MNLNPEKIQHYKSHMNISVAIQDHLKTIEVSALISCTCVASICHAHMKFPLKIRFNFNIVLEKYRILG